jgi:type VI secretion system secreted protein VgrG
VRHFNGYVTDFSLAESIGSYARYVITVRPWLWLLSRTSNCRIFQNMTVPEIIKQVFRDHGFTDFEESLTGSFASREYVVQYRETDFNFVSRLMEHEGIYYFFKHTETNHSLVLSDSYSAHAPATGYESLPYFPPDDHRGHEVDFVDHWQSSHQIEPGAYALTDFDFEKPNAGLLAKLSLPNDHDKADFEVFDYPGTYTQVSQGEDYARLRLEELNVEHARADGQSNARGVGVGCLFTLADHPVESQNAEYLVISARSELRTHDPRSGAEIPDEDVYRCTFSVIESSRPFRTARTTRKPLVTGPQTAIVVGKSGEEIWTDNYGRVKVQFHWDRYNKGDESSSCWVRVAQVWAGSGWGGMHVPRIGQEVIVDFLEGDPDRPVITGRLYNGDNAPPFALPANQTQSGLKSRSSKKGGPNNFNEIRLEDKKGSEQIFVQAEKDFDALVKNDETRVVKHDQSIVVENDREKLVKKNETVNILGNRTETVAKNETITVGAHRAETVALTESVTIGAARSTMIGAADMLEVGGAQSVTVGGVRSINVGGGEASVFGGTRAATIGTNESVSIGGSRTEDVAKDESVSILGKRKHDVKKDDVLNVGKKLQINVTEEIVIKSGAATISMKKNGDIVIKGKNITLDGSGKVNVKASSDVVLKGSKISQN